MGNILTAKLVGGIRTTSGDGRAEPPVSWSNRVQRDSRSLRVAVSGTATWHKRHKCAISVSAFFSSKDVNACSRAMSIMLSLGFACASPCAKASVFSKVTFCAMPNVRIAASTAFTGGGGMALARSSGRAGFSFFSFGRRMLMSSLVQRGFLSFTMVFAAALKSERVRVMTERCRSNE